MPAHDVSCETYGFLSFTDRRRRQYSRTPIHHALNLPRKSVVVVVSAEISFEFVNALGAQYTEKRVVENTFVQLIQREIPVRTADDGRFEVSYSIKRHRRISCRKNSEVR